jgi:class 3 adenylate cyclase
VPAEQTSVRTFVIADIRGYSRYTDEFGDEAAARLAAKFSCLVGEGVEAHGGEVVEIRGDEALAVFTSARQAIRAAVDLQKQFDEETDLDHELPLRVGIGVDSGEAVSLEDGSFRGQALNIAARLCGRAHGGEVLVSESTYRLAGRMAGLAFSDRGRVRLKNIEDAIHVLHVHSDQVTPQSKGWVVMFFGKPGRTLGWKLAGAIILIAGLTAAGVVYLTASDRPEGGNAAPPIDSPGPGGIPLPADAGLEVLVPEKDWADCHLQTVAEPGAAQTAVCLPANGTPDRWQISMYADGGALEEAYDTALAAHPTLERDTGQCNALSWGGEREWLHGPDRPGGRAFCFFEGNDAVIVWTHERLGQPTHRDILVSARESGSDHADLTRWWRPLHHEIGKAD